MFVLREGVFLCNIAEVSAADRIYVQIEFISIMNSTIVHKNLTLSCTQLQMMAFTLLKQTKLYGQLKMGLSQNH